MTCTCPNPCQDCGERVYQQLQDICDGGQNSLQSSVSVGTSEQVPTKTETFPNRETEECEEPRSATLQGQLAAFDEHFDHAADLAIHMLTHYRVRIREGARSRLVAGFPIYGSRTWRCFEDDVWDEAMEEASDLVNYLVMVLEMRDGK